MKYSPINCNFLLLLLYSFYPFRYRYPSPNFLIFFTFFLFLVKLLILFFVFLLAFPYSPICCSQVFWVSLSFFFTPYLSCVFLCILFNTTGRILNMCLFHPSTLFPHFPFPSPFLFLPLPCQYSFLYFPHFPFPSSFFFFQWVKSIYFPIHVQFIIH